MASDAYTLDRLRNLLQQRNILWQEQKMFGGICFMVDDKMCFGTSNRGLLFRVNPDEGEALSARPGITFMEHGGKPMQGYLRATPEACDRDEDLAFWVDLCLAYNPLAKGSKKK